MTKKMTAIKNEITEIKEKIEKLEKLGYTGDIVILEYERIDDLENALKYHEKFYLKFIVNQSRLDMIIMFHKEKFEIKVFIS